ncbi:hypothetical protein BDZ97DRAFT_1761488 [Flammula alnicola]|nr:hypothetical protein BDZ97DRAFT_1761488 [Flammula alnicola]
MPIAQRYVMFALAFRLPMGAVAEVNVLFPDLLNPWTCISTADPALYLAMFHPTRSSGTSSYEMEVALGMLPSLWVKRRKWQLVHEKSTKSPLVKGLFSKFTLGAACEDSSPIVQWQWLDAWAR